MGYEHVGRTDDAAACYESSIALYRDGEDPSLQDFANALLAFAQFCQESGRTVEARSLLVDAARQYAKADLKEGVEYCNKQLAAMDMGDPR